MQRIKGIDFEFRELVCLDWQDGLKSERNICAMI